MPQLADPSGIRSRPDSVALGELAIAAGLVGESVTIASDFPAHPLCQIWKHYGHALTSAHVIHAHSKSDVKNLEHRIADVRAVFVHSPRLYEDVAWKIQMVGLGASHPVPAIVCGFQHEDPESDPGLTLSLTNDEREVAAIMAWASGGCDCDVVELPIPSSVTRDRRLETALRPPTLERGGLGHRELRIAAALVDGAALLRTANTESGGPVQTTLSDYGFVRNLLCSSSVKPNREACHPLTLAMTKRANVYLSVKFGEDRSNPFAVVADDSYRRSHSNSLQRDVITRRELADLGNINSQLVVALIEFLQRAEAGYPSYLQMSCTSEPVPEHNWKRLSARELAKRLKGWSPKQVRTHFDRLQQDGLVTVKREQANGPLHYEIPEELENVASPFSQLPTAPSLH